MLSRIACRALCLIAVLSAVPAAAQTWYLKEIRVFPPNEQHSVVAQRFDASGGYVDLSVPGTHYHFCDGGNEVIRFEWSFDRNVSAMSPGQPITARVTARQLSATAPCRRDIGRRSELVFHGSRGLSAPPFSNDEALAMDGDRFGPTGAARSGAAIPEPGETSTPVGTIQMSTNPPGRPLAYFMVMGATPAGYHRVVYIYDNRLSSSQYGGAPAVAAAPPPTSSPGAAIAQGFNLTGRWQGNDGGTYYIRQVGEEVFWFGASGDGGRTWTNVLHAALQGNRVLGRWADVPQGQVQNSGEMEIAVVTPDRLSATRRTGGFGGSEWTRIGATTGSSAIIRVLAGTYGQTCNQPRGNKTQHLAGSCNGRDTCEYTVDVQAIGDPAFGCRKDYVAEWQCGDDPQVRTASAAPEAGYGSKVQLSCGATATASAPAAAPKPAAGSVEQEIGNALRKLFGR